MNNTGNAPQRIKVTNARILTPYRIIPHGTILITGKTITEISERDIDVPDALELDAGGAYVSPGFIDLHVHGGGGYDFMDGSEEAFLRIAELHAQYGTTAMVPTTLTSTRQELFNTLEIYEKANAKNTAGARFLGMHLEGPYFAMSQRGAQDPRYIRDPDPDEYQEVLARSSSVTRWSAAPELKGALKFGQFLRSKGVLAAVAHTDAVYEEVLAAVENGYSLATHLYSAMSGVTRRNSFRYAGVIESAYLLDQMDVELIADGVHLPAPLLKLAYKIKGAERTALITDAMRAAGMPPGNSILGSLHNGTEVIVEDGVAKMPDRQAFAGSVATADRLVRTMINLADIPLLDTIRMISSTPARIMGVADRKGILAPGKDADLVFFDADISIQLTMVEGRIVYQRESIPVF
ncbi:N-acetylglucosamine-6-phosphate deacetylase [Larkinella humicola]|uniref:N-acetylglucosamine-6-phosphate deacetylase n=1 Tax=Larkinella humicola TaxID=2607654 RepID=A0A5N1JIH4_9BACT|nr:N-acetylglucosamine-6-phosphate deacetylase [Larkinella humicola]KAA9355175.1 N-acetylglucosamine-6-phosphate deacetylase [Larkinella humicola]